MVKISIIICTHNPKSNYLERTLNGLRKQTLSFQLWELLLIDNGSDSSLSDSVDISWQPNGKHIREEELGLTPARLRGIRESEGELLLFVDDDNILKENYLELVLKIMQINPLVGALGAGRILPEFELEPSDQLKPFMIMLALRDEERAHYSNQIAWNKSIPYGAGLCVRHIIAEAYLESCRVRSHASSLDRKGTALLSGGDIDIALHACRDGLLTGVMPELELVHIIPKSRLEPDYLVRIAAGHVTSHYLLAKLWGYHNDLSENPFLKIARYWKKRLHVKGLARKIFIAEQRAEKKAELNWNKSGETK